MVYGSNVQLMPTFWNVQRYGNGKTANSSIEVRFTDSTQLVSKISNLCWTDDMQFQYRVLHNNSDWSFGCWLWTPNLGEEEAVRGRDDTAWKGFGKFLRSLHSNVSSIFARFRYIAAFVLLHATFSHPTSSESSLPKISPGFPVSRWLAFGIQRAKVFC